MKKIKVRSYYRFRNDKRQLVHEHYRNYGAIGNKVIPLICNDLSLGFQLLLRYSL